MCGGWGGGGSLAGQNVMIYYMDVERLGVHREVYVAQSAVSMAVQSVNNDIKK